MALTNLNLEKLNIIISVLPNGYRLEFVGDIDMQEPDAVLTPYFDKVHQEIIKDKYKMVELDFLKLTFLNSSGIKTLIKWIKVVNFSPAEAQYKFKMIANSQVPWQESSLKLLSMLSPQLAEVSIV